VLAHQNTVVRIDLFARSAEDSAPGTLTVADRADKTDAGTRGDVLKKISSLNDLLIGRWTHSSLPAQPASELKFYFEHAYLSEFWIAVN